MNTMNFTGCGRWRRIFWSSAILSAGVFTLSAQSDAAQASGGSCPAVYSDYSRWSVGVHAGLPFQRGDFHSFSHDKTYVGIMGGLQAAYQIAPWIGVSLTGDWGRADGGAKGNELNFILKPDGDSYYGPWENRPAGSVHYNDLWNRVKYMTFGLHADLVVNNFFRTPGREDRRWTVLLSPAVYLQKFDPTVYSRADDQRFTDRDLDNGVNLGLGGDVALRYRTGRHIDLELKAGIAWIDNNRFDGITTCCTKQFNWLATASIGVVWKIGNKQKKDNLMYAPVRRAVPVPVAPVPEKKKEEPVSAPAPAPVQPVPEQPAVVVAADRLPALPAVYFRRGDATIDRVKYRSALEAIVKALKEAPDVQVSILGYADHTGGTPVNDRITKARAEALKAYLVSEGIPAGRLSIRGMGKDRSLTGEEAYSEKARRVEVREE